MPLTVYGIPNCDTVKKARVFLDAQGLAPAFHDFRKDGLTADMVQGWLAQVPMDKLLNKRGTSWRKLSDADKANEDQGHLIALMVDSPTLIKRPVIDRDGSVTVGFDKTVQALFG